MLLPLTIKLKVIFKKKIFLKTAFNCPETRYGSGTESGTVMCLKSQLELEPEP
jgi:hypothetical protein